MQRKRKNIPAGIRWKVFQRDEFKCVYCGASRGMGAELVIDHGDPFSRGGEDAIDNFVTACRLCNAGKRDEVFIPQAAGEPTQPPCERVVRRGVAYENHLHADWSDAFRQACIEAKYLSLLDCPTVLRVARGYGGENLFSVLRLDFRCKFWAPEIGEVNVVILPNSDRGEWSQRDCQRLRDAAIVGYGEPTAIIIGSPWCFYGFVVNERHKGCPKGFVLDERLERGDSFYFSGWYPDEAWSRLDFDPRDERETRLARCLDLRAWGKTFWEMEKELSDGI